MMINKILEISCPILTKPINKLIEKEENRKYNIYLHQIRILKKDPEEAIRIAESSGPTIYEIYAKRIIRLINIIIILIVINAIVQILLIILD